VENGHPESVLHGLHHPSVVVLAALLGVISSGRGQSSEGAADLPDAQPATPQMVSEPSGASRCTFCHRAEVEGYARSAMAHSLRRAGHEPDGRVTTPTTKITMYSSPTGYWQRLESGGHETNYRIDYVMGSGNHASGYLTDLAGHLFQSPVSYYTSRRSYDLAPGYEDLPNPDFSRPIKEDCVFCHSGTALHVSGTSNQYREPIFLADAITCERCHGSAEKHLSNPTAGTIINPAKLEPGARDSICEQCHLSGVIRVLNPGKTFTDFRPGERLEDTLITYCDALPAGTEAGNFKVISHVEQLAKSMCARMSKGQLWCGTCHDPHNKPLEPVQFYRSKCLSCHTGSFSDAHPGRDSDCISCHMPKRDAKDGGHTAFTDHRIQRRPQPEIDLPADIDIAAWREPAPDLQKRNLGMAYIYTAMKRRSSPFLVRGYHLLAEVKNQFPTDSELFTSMGTALLLTKQTSAAEQAFERALQLNPDSVAAERNVASAYLQAGDLDRAVAHSEHAVALDPLNVLANNALIELYKQQGNTAKAAELSDKVSAAKNQYSAAAETGEKLVPTSSPQVAEAVFKNIQVLKGVSADQLIPAMRFMAGSLGVECNYCHVENHFEKDDKKPKQIAREMMRMMFSIDKGSFEGNREVTCYSCHRGSPKPQTVPIVGRELQPMSQMAADAATRKLPVNLPTADQVIDRYIQAIGGAGAIEKITSREEKGSTTLDGKSISVEVFEQGPDRRALVQHTPAGDSITVFNGHEGWSVIPGRPVRDSQGADRDAAQMDADLHFPLHIKQVFAELTVEYPEKVGDREAYVILGAREGQPPVKLYFDQQSGLLVRLVRYAESPVGLAPTRIDYSDYRDAGGVKTPYRWTVAQPDGSSTIQLEQVRQNVPIDDARFAKPA